MKPCRACTDITCDDCGDTYVVTGETPTKRLAALAIWTGCDHAFPVKAAS